MCFDTFLKCVCRLLPASESDFLFSVCVSPSSLLCLFQCYVANIYLLDNCTLPAVCAQYVIRVIFFFKLWDASHVLQHLVGQKIQLARSVKLSVKIICMELHIF